MRTKRKKILLTNNDYYIKLSAENKHISVIFRGTLDDCKEMAIDLKNLYPGNIWIYNSDNKELFFELN